MDNSPSGNGAYSKEFLSHTKEPWKVYTRDMQIDVDPETVCDTMLMLFDWISANRTCMDQEEGE